MGQSKRQRGHILSAAGLHRLQAKLTQLETQQGYKFTPQILAHRTQLVDAQGLHATTVKKILEQRTGVDRRSIEIIFQALELEPNYRDYQLGAQPDRLLQPERPLPSPRGTAEEGHPVGTPEFPGGPVPLASPYYVSRQGLQDQACAEISQPGGLVRIKAPRKMGKSSFALRLQQQAETSGYRVLQVDLKRADEAVLSDIDRFLRWLCRVLSQQLGLSPSLDDYWEADIGSKVSCTIYLQQALLKAADCPVVLLFNDIDRIFEYPAIFYEFLPLLRSWHEEAKGNIGLQKIRFILTYSTEIYVPLNLNQSPFNVGLPVHLSKLATEEVRSLVRAYRLSDAVIEPLTELVSGHPYLTQLALYHLWAGPMNLPDLLQWAITPAGIYANHLNQCLASLQGRADLAAALQQVIKAETGIHLGFSIATKLESLGLIDFSSRCLAKPSCQLYQRFFSTHFALADRSPEA
ncbi:MAG: AAA-like domain-containing protein [Nodosilinea sp.]